MDLKGSPPTDSSFLYYSLLSSHLMPLSAAARARHTSPSETSQPITRPIWSPQSNFSISKILGIPDVCAPSSEKAPVSLVPLALPHQNQQMADAAKLMWLQHLGCPTTSPLMPGRHLFRKVAKKRKLGRNPRIPFTQQQIDCLEKKYTSSRYLSSMDVVSLSNQLELSEARVKIWFQNRRARERRDKKSDLSAGSSTPASSPSFASSISHVPVTSDLWTPALSLPKPDSSITATADCSDIE